MAIADGAGLPLATTVASANPAETALVDATLDARFLRRRITRLISDKGYHSDKLDAQLAARGIECIAPNRSTRRHNKQDERHVEDFLGFVQLACSIILSRQLVR